MAIFHATIKAFSRGKGHSATAAAAYRAGIRILDLRTGVIHDYTRRRGVVSIHQLAPTGAPAWCLDPSGFWNANELAETRANARVAREVEISLPNELAPEQRQKLAIELGRLIVERFDAAALVAVHAPDRKGDDRNHHVHILVSARKVGAEGLGGRAMSEMDAREGVGASAIRDLRALVSAKINEHLALAGNLERVDHRSLADQANAAEMSGNLSAAVLLSREPTGHEGKASTNMRRRGAQSDRADLNQQVKTANGSSVIQYLAEATALGNSGGALAAAANTQPCARSISNAAQQTQPTINAYAKIHAMSTEDAAALAKICEGSRWCLELLRKALDARENSRQAISRPIRERDKYGAAMVRTVAEQKSAAEIEADKPSYWRFLSRRRWAERRRHQAAKVAEAIADEKRASRAVGTTAMAAYAVAVVDAQRALDDIEGERIARYPLPTEPKKEAANKRVANALKAAREVPHREPSPETNTPDEDNGKHQRARPRLRPR